MISSVASELITRERMEICAKCMKSCCIPTKPKKGCTCQNKVENLAPSILSSSPQSSNPLEDRSLEVRELPRPVTRYSYPIDIPSPQLRPIEGRTFHRRELSILSLDHREGDRVTEAPESPRDED